MPSGRYRTISTRGKRDKSGTNEKRKAHCLMTDIHYLADSLTDKGEEFQYMVEHGDGKLTTMCGRSQTLLLNR